MGRLALQRGLALALGCLNIMLSGITLSFTVFSEQLKDEFDLQQTSVEIIASLGVLGASIGYPVGLVYESWGSVRSYIFTITVGTLAAILLYTTKYAQDFYSENWWLLAIYWTMYGVAALFMFLIPLTVNMGNFSPRHRGLIVGTTGAAWWLGSAILSAIYNGCFSGEDTAVGDFFLFIAVLTIAINSLCAWLVCPIAPTPEEAEEWQQLVPNTVMKPEESQTAVASFSDRYGLNLLFVPEFHILTWGFLLSGCIQLAYVPNVTTFSLSYDLSGLDPVLTVVSPLSASIIKFLSGALSDSTLDIFPRLLYLLVMTALQFLCLLLSIFLGDNEALFITLTLVIYTTNGTYWAIIPTVLSEYFGMKHFCRNWGFEFFVNALLTFAVLGAFGTFYDNSIALQSDNTCYGLQCFVSYYILGSVTTGVSLGLFIWLYIRERSGTIK